MNVNFKIHCYFYHSIGINNWIFERNNIKSNNVSLVFLLHLVDPYIIRIGNCWIGVEFESKFNILLNVLQINCFFMTFFNWQSKYAMKSYHASGIHKKLIDVFVCFMRYIHWILNDKTLFGWHGQSLWSERAFRQILYRKLIEKDLFSIESENVSILMNTILTHFGRFRLMAC